MSPYSFANYALCGAPANCADDRLQTVYSYSYAQSIHMVLAPGPDYSSVKEYFQSIEKVFEDTLSSKNKTDFWEQVRNVTIFLLVFSVIPVLPYVTQRLLRYHAFHIRGITFSMAALWMWWLLCVFSFTLILIALASVTNRRTEAKRSTWLSRPQLRFALSYAIVNEIEKYQTNRLPKPISKASDYEVELWSLVAELFNDNFGHMLVTSESIEGLRVHLLPITQFDILRRRFSWLRLESRTEKILNAFGSYHDKIRGRIVDKKDLRAISYCLLYLSGYFYSQIPELQSDPVQETDGKSVPLEQWGEKQLDLFASTVAEFSEYSPEEEKLAKQQLLKQRVESRVTRMSNVFSHENIFVCFSSWLICLAALVWLGTWAMLRAVPALRMDSVLVSMVIGTPIIGAATLVAIARHRRKE
jgi:hypothetical protein